jgi:hypothetical protein
MNVKRKFITCFIAIMTPTLGMSQNKLIPSLEVGLSCSQFPSKNTVVTWQISDSTITKKSPLIGPLIGISTNFHLTERFKIIFGFNYELTGTKTYSYTQSTAPNILPISYFKDWQKLIIHKVCIPIEIGFEFNCKNIRPMIFVGTKPNILISAKLHEKSFHSQWTESVKTNTNLFSKKADYQPPQRIINQFNFGFMIPIGQNLKVSLSYNLGHNYFSDTYWVRGISSRVGYDVKTSIKSSEYILSILYKIKDEKKNGSP